MIPSVKIYSEINELYSKTLVTQTFTNKTKNPLELKEYLYLYKKHSIILSSFNIKIGDSITVKSKVIKKEKMEVKYTDAIASGNSAISIMEDETNNNRLIINLGNIPPNQELIFTCEFIQYTTFFNDCYQFELFKNIPLLVGNKEVYQNNKIIGNIVIKSKNKIKNVKKQLLSENIKITKAKYEDENKNKFLISYVIKNIPKITFWNIQYWKKYEDIEYIPNSKIYFEIELNDSPYIFKQKSLIDINKNYYNIHYRIPAKECIKKSMELSENLPALFIFLVDQSGSMEGEPMEIVIKSLLLFLQSLPAGSYYQIIGFGSFFKKYDKWPREYTQKNIETSMKLIQSLKADFKGTNIYKPLTNIYESNKYDNIKLKRNIFILTDGYVEDKEKTLDIIKKNKKLFSIYSIGIGDEFDEDLIKSAGILGNGNYNFCVDFNDLNSMIVNEINISTCPFISRLDLNSDLDNNYLVKIGIIPVDIKRDMIINLGYINEKKEEENNKININIKIIKSNNEIIEKNFAIESEEIPQDEVLSKLIIYNYLLDNKYLDYSKKLKLSLKYQILTEFTSLFTEVELSEETKGQLQLEIIGQDTAHIITKKKPEEKKIQNEIIEDNHIRNTNLNFEPPPINMSPQYHIHKTNKISRFFKNIISGIFSFRTYGCPPNYDNYDVGSSRSDTYRVYSQPPQYLSPANYIPPYSELEKKILSKEETTKTQIKKEEEQKLEIKSKENEESKEIKNEVKKEDQKL